MKKFSRYFLGLILSLTGCELFGMEYSSEMIKMKHAYQKRKEGTYGFEGCKNQAICGSDGFYGATYSKEGLCKECEFKDFPDRYTACLFCRMPNQKIKGLVSHSCLWCETGVEEKLKSALGNTIPDEYQGKLSQAIFQYIVDARHTVARKSIPALARPNVRRRLFNHFYESYIYRGAMKSSEGKKVHVWVNNISIADEDKRTVSPDELPEYISFIGGKYNIFGPETGALTTDQIPEGALTYQEDE